jgi:large subunit ribosomal protein L13
VSRLLIGKHRVDFARHEDMGDSVEVKNISRALWTGNKLQTKVYRHHTGYPGGLKEERLGDLWVKNPAEALRRAVWNMLPKTRHRKEIFKRLHVVSGL